MMVVILFLVIMLVAVIMLVIIIMLLIRMVMILFVIMMVIFFCAGMEPVSSVCLNSRGWNPLAANIGLADFHHFSPSSFCRNYRQIYFNSFIIINIILDNESAFRHTCLENIARIANAVPFTLYSRVAMNNEIVVLNCQKCNQCLTYHKSQG